MKYKCASSYRYDGLHLARSIADDTESSIGEPPVYIQLVIWGRML